MSTLSDYEDAFDSISAEGGPLGEGLRRRLPADDTFSLCSTDVPGLHEVEELLEGDLSDIDDEDPCTGCPLPSTPVDPSLFDREVAEVIASTEKYTKKVWSVVCSFTHLPHWLQDNEYLHHGHRPPLRTFMACIYSVFRIHTETGNIWTHLLGCLFFLGIFSNLMTAPEMGLTDKTMIGAFLLGGIICFFLSSAFHTVCCHSEFVGKLFSKLDYCGIAILITVSFIPWLYYSFYCDFKLRMIYVSVVLVLGISAVIVSLWDKFSESRLRPVRAVVFAVFGLSGIVPAVHYTIEEGYTAFLGWLILMGSLYLLGAAFYAFRVPECFFPGRFDIWLQSHQIFHVLVVAAASVHYHGITEMWAYRMSMGACSVQTSSFFL